MEVIQPCRKRSFSFAIEGFSYILIMVLIKDVRYLDLFFFFVRAISNFWPDSFLLSIGVGIVAERSCFLVSGSPYQ